MLVTAWQLVQGLHGTCVDIRRLSASFSYFLRTLFGIIPARGTLRQGLLLCYSVTAQVSCNPYGLHFCFEYNLLTYIIGCTYSTVIVRYRTFWRQRTSSARTSSASSYSTYQSLAAVRTKREIRTNRTCTSTCTVQGLGGLKRAYYYCGSLIYISTGYHRWELVRFRFVIVVSIGLPVLQ